MGARRKYPQFEDLTTEEFAELLRLSKLSPKQKQIAVQCIFWTDMAFVDIGEANGGYTRKTISRWMRETIVPELERVRKKYCPQNDTSIEAGA